jgi:hypothetical protein
VHYVGVFLCSCLHWAPSAPARRCLRRPCTRVTGSISPSPSVASRGRRPLLAQCDAQYGLRMLCANTPRFCPALEFSCSECPSNPRYGLPAQSLHMHLLHGLSLTICHRSVKPVSGRNVEKRNRGLASMTTGFTVRQSCCKSSHFASRTTPRASHRSACRHRLFTPSGTLCHCIQLLNCFGAVQTQPLAARARPMPAPPPMQPLSRAASTSC